MYLKLALIWRIWRAAGLSGNLAAEIEGVSPLSQDNANTASVSGFLLNPGFTSTVPLTAASIFHPICQEEQVQERGWLMSAWQARCRARDEVQEGEEEDEGEDWEEAGPASTKKQSWGGQSGESVERLGWVEEETRTREEEWRRREEEEAREEKKKREEEDRKRWNEMPKTFAVRRFALDLLRDLVGYICSQ